MKLRFTGRRLFVAGALVLIVLAFACSRYWRGHQFSSIIESCEAHVRTQLCLTNAIVAVAKERGIDAGFDALVAVYARDTAFAETCHAVTHTLGEMAYQSFKQHEQFALSANTAFCGFGFYHGFMESLLFDTGDISEARRFCDYADQKMTESFSGVSFACYHGIGHGVVDGSDESRWGNIEKFIEPGLKLCEQVGDNLEHKTRCASGVFNALGIAYLTSKYKLPVNVNDPYAVCREQSLAYQQKACYDQMNSYIVPAVRDFAKAVSLASQTPNEYRAIAIGSVAGLEAKYALARDSVEKDIGRCLSLPQGLQQTCTNGFAVGLIEFGKPGQEFTASINACSKTGPMADACFHAISASASARTSRTGQERVCADIRAAGGERAGEDCRAFISSGNPS